MLFTVSAKWYHTFSREPAASDRDSLASSSVVLSAASVLLIVVHDSLLSSGDTGTIFLYL